MANAQLGEFLERQLAGDRHNAHHLGHARDIGESRHVDEQGLEHPVGFHAERPRRLEPVVALTRVVVELVHADSTLTRVASALSDGSGTYALRAPGAGRYRVVAKRIGVHRFTSSPFELAVGETRTVDVHVHWLRSLIEDDPATPRFLQTVRGVGYVLRLPDA